MGERLKVEMALYGVRAATVAKRAGMHEAYLSRVLAGTTKPRPATIRRIIEAIHADILDAPVGKAA